MVKRILKSIVIVILRIEAGLVLLRYRPQIIAITGSVGKTGTKDAIYALLNEYFYVSKSEKSYNSEIGVPLAILREETAWNSFIGWIVIIVRSFSLIIFKNHYPKWLILEAGVDRPGDMKKNRSLISADIVVMTKFPETPVHIEFFNTRDDVFIEKWELVKSLKKDGTLIVNEGDENIMKFVTTKHKGSYLTYGLGLGMVKASNICYTYKKAEEVKIPTGVTFKVIHDGNTVPIRCRGALGEAFVENIIPAVAVGISLGLNLIKIANALNIYSPPPGRMKILGGVNGSTIIDDTYNSSPEAVLNALRTLNNIESTGKKYLVLGDMLELGKYTTEEHEKIGKLIPKGIEEIYFVGPRAALIADGLSGSGYKKSDIKFYPDSESAGRALKRKLGKGDLALFKGSQRIRLERGVIEVMHDRTRAKELLVRQESEWTNR